MANSNKSTWNLTPLFKDDNDPEMTSYRKEVEERSYEFINKWKDRTDYLENPKVLVEALTEFEAWAKHYAMGGREGYYLMLRSSQEQDNNELKAKSMKLKDFLVKISNDIEFFEHRLAKIPEQTQNKILNFPELAPFRHYLESLFSEAKYLLSEQEEKLISAISPSASYYWVDMVSEFISREDATVLTEKGELETLSFEEILNLLKSTNKQVRNGAAKALNTILEKHAPVAEHEMNAILDYKKTLDGLRKTPRPDYLRHLSDDIDSEVVDTLIEAVSNGFDTARKYYELKAKILGVDKLEYHERNVPVGETDKNYFWEDSVSLIDKVFTNLDPEFGEIFRNMVKNGQYDAFPRKGKSGGAFCVMASTIYPIYVLLNHTNKLNDVTTIAHETGHAINSTFIAKNQNSLNDASPFSTAEVASTFMEDFVFEEVLKEADEEERLILMMEKLNDEISTIYRQVAAYKFEQELHKTFNEKGYLPKEQIGEMFSNHMSEYMGDFVEQSEGSGNWWVYWDHFRRFFYVYSYASGLLISKSMQNSVKKDPAFVQNVKKFLSAGSSAAPDKIFAEMGIDIKDKNFWQKGLDEVNQLLEDTEKLAKKLNKF